MVFALHQVFRTARHVIAEIIETEFVVGSVGDICFVGLAALGRIRLVVVDAINGQAEEFEQRTVPLAVSSGEVIVHSNDMHTALAEGIEISGQGRNEGFTFTGTHFSDFTAVQGQATDELHVVVHHVPSHLSAGGSPFIRKAGFVA